MRIYCSLQCKMVQCTQPNVYIKILLLTVICKQKDLQIYIFSRTTLVRPEKRKNIFEWHLSRVVKSLDQSSKFSAAEMTKLENWCTICSFPLITMCQIIFLKYRLFFNLCQLWGRSQDSQFQQHVISQGKKRGYRGIFLCLGDTKMNGLLSYGLEKKKKKTTQQCHLLEILLNALLNK